MRLLHLLLAALPLVAATDIPGQGSSDLNTFTDTPPDASEGCKLNTVICSYRKDGTSWLAACTPNGQYMEVLFCGKGNCCKNLEGGELMFAFVLFEMILTVMQARQLVLVTRS